MKYIIFSLMVSCSYINTTRSTSISNSQISEYVSPITLENDTCNGYYDEYTRKCIYIIVDKMPSYNGNKFAIYFAKEFQYPKNFNEIITKINVQFIVDENGEIVGERIMNKKMIDINPVESEALRVIRSMKNSWTAGEQNGEKVAVLLSFSFNIEPKLE